MIAVDTSSMVSYLQGQKGGDVKIIEEGLAQGVLVFPPVVFTELISDHLLGLSLKVMLGRIPLLSLTDGYWERAGLLRARLRQKGYHSKVADSLIAQSCLDHDIALVTRDRDFLAFAKYGGLRLVR